MITKLLKIIIFLPLLISACYKPKPHDLKNQSSLRVTEREDYKKCLTMGIEFTEGANNDDFWHCRYVLSKARSIHDKIETAALEQNSNIPNVDSHLLLNEDGNFDHSNCISKGYTLENGSDEEIEAYYQCRENIILERIIIDAKINSDYKASITSNRKAYPTIPQVKINPNEENIEAIKKTYQLCRELSPTESKFKKCVEVQKEAKKCFVDLGVHRFKKDLDDKIYCQQQAYVQFPDDYGFVKDKSPDEIRRIKEKEKLAEIEKKKKEEDKIKTNLTLKFLKGNTDELKNSGMAEEQKVTPKEAEKILQSKIELWRLREQYIEKCNKSMVSKLPNFIEEAANNCMKMAINWDN